MTTLFATSQDGTRLAYDCSGAGPALVLVHGGGSRRQEWHDTGYVSRLQTCFTVITLDLRGHGESDLPATPADYASDKMVQDVLAVVDACGVACFSIWGFSFGGKVSRYVAAHSGRVIKLVLMGTPLGGGVSDGFRKEFDEFCAHWSPLLQAQRDGTLDLDALSLADREFLQTFHVPAMLGWGRAMIDWPAVEPIDLRCPTLWLVGSEDQVALNSVRKYEPVLNGTRVQVQLLEGLSHEQVFDELDRVFETLLAFMQA